MTRTLEDFFQVIKEEREYQNSKWGEEFDKFNTANDWIAYIVNYTGKAVTLPWDEEQFLIALQKVAALCAAAWTRDSFPPRHYDKEQS